MSIIRPKNNGIFLPKKFIKEELDRVHRQDWEDPDRYERQKQKALRYLKVRAADIDNFAWEKLVREAARVFHDDLASDPEIKEAAQRACWAAEKQWRRDQDLDILPPAPAAEEGPPRAFEEVFDRTEGTLSDLEWQLNEELKEP